MNCKQADQTSIEGYLASLGIFPAKRHGQTLMYLSPYRNEKTASFALHAGKNLWHDHADNRGGGLVKLVMLMSGADTAGALAIIGGSPFSLSSPQPAPRQTAPAPAGISIKKIKPLENKALISYAESRGIPAQTAQSHFLEAYYERAEAPGGKPFFALAWRGEAGGLELRNRYFKGCSGPKSWTCIDGPDTGIVLVFEGYFDYVSFLALTGSGKTPCPAYILNSAGLAGQVAALLAPYRSVRCYLDNDDAGRAATETFRAVLGAKVSDRSGAYAPCKDINDYLTANQNKNL